MKLIPFEKSAVPAMGGREVAMHEESIRNDRKIVAVETPVLLLKAYCLFLLWLALPAASLFKVPGVLIWSFATGWTLCSAVKSFAWFAASAASIAFPGRPALPGNTTPELADFENTTREAVEEWDCRAAVWNETLERNGGKETAEMKAARMTLEARRDKIAHAIAYLETRRPKTLPAPKETFEPGTRVVDDPTGRAGRVTHDHFGCCAPGEIPVVYDGGSGYEGTDRRRLSVLSPVG